MTLAMVKVLGRAEAGAPLFAAFEPRLFEHGAEVGPDGWACRGPGDGERNALVCAGGCGFGFGMKEAAHDATDRVYGRVGDRADYVGGVEGCDHLEIECSGRRDSAAACGRSNLGQVAVDVCDLSDLGRGAHGGAQRLDVGAAAGSAERIEALDFGAEVESGEPGVVDLRGPGDGGGGDWAGDGEIGGEGAAMEGRTAGQTDSEGGQQLLQLIDGEIGRGEMEVKRDGLPCVPIAALDMHGDRAGVDGDIGNLPGARLEIFGDRVVDVDRVRGGRAGARQLKLGGLDLSIAGEGGSVGRKLRAISTTMEMPWLRSTTPAATGIKMLELQVGVERACQRRFSARAGLRCR